MIYICGCMYTYMYLAANNNDNIHFHPLYNNVWIKLLDCNIHVVYSTHRKNLLTR